MSVILSCSSHPWPRIVITEATSGVAFGYKMIKTIYRRDILVIFKHNVWDNFPWTTCEYGSDESDYAKKLEDVFYRVNLSDILSTIRFEMIFLFSNL